MTPRERLRVFLMLTGIVLFFCGGAIACAGPTDKVDSAAGRMGAWKGGAARGVPKEVAPWLLLGGVAAFVASFVARDI